MTLALQIPPEEQCLDFPLAYEIVSMVCKSIGFNFNQARLRNIAIVFDALVCEGESPAKAITTAIDIEIALRGNPVKPPAHPKPQEQKSGFGLQRMARDEEDALLVLIEFHEIETDSLRCHFTRQQGSGKFKASREFRYLPQNWNISYDLILCEFCGNFEGMKANTPYCPAKLRILRDRLLGDGDHGEDHPLLSQ